MIKHFNCSSVNTNDGIIKWCKRPHLPAFLSPTIGFRRMVWFGFLVSDDDARGLTLLLVNMIPLLIILGLLAFPLWCVSLDWWACLCTPIVAVNLLDAIAHNTRLKSLFESVVPVPKIEAIGDCFVLEPFIWPPHTIPDGYSVLFKITLLRYNITRVLTVLARHYYSTWLGNWFGLNPLQRVRKACLNKTNKAITSKQALAQSYLIWHTLITFFKGLTSAPCIQRPWSACSWVWEYSDNVI